MGDRRRWWLLGVLALWSWGLVGVLHAEDLTEMMGKADALWAQRADLAKCKESIKIYEGILVQDPKSVEALWKLARAHWWLGGHSPEDQKLAIFEKGVEYAKQGVALRDDCIECHYWLGVNYGVYGEAKGVLKSLSLVDPIKEEMNKVIKLDPKFMQGGAYRVLGRMAYKLPWFAGGSKKESVEYLKKGLEVGPNNFLTRVFLAETYLAMDEKELARKELEWVINAPDTGDPGDKEDKETARKLFEQNFK